MYKTYRTTKDTIMGIETRNLDIRLTLIMDAYGKEYVLVKMQGGQAIYNLSLFGRVIEIVPDISFEEFRDMTDVKLNKLRQH